MDRPTILTSVNVPARPELGVKVREAETARDLADQLQTAIDAAAAGSAVHPLLTGLEVAAGGGGAGWRGTVTLVANLGWGHESSIPASLAKLKMREAQNWPEIETQLGYMYTEIAAEASNDPFVWNPRIVGSGRDGTYLIALLWSDGFPGIPTMDASEPGQLGPFVAETTIVSLVIPQSVNGIVDTEHSWVVHWDIMVQDTAATGVYARLERNGVPVQEAQITGLATDWWPCGSHLVHDQDSTGATTYDVVIEPVVGFAQVTVRDTHLTAVECVWEGAPS